MRLLDRIERLPNVLSKYIFDLIPNEDAGKALVLETRRWALISRVNGLYREPNSIEFRRHGFWAHNDMAYREGRCASRHDGLLIATDCMFQRFVIPSLLKESIENVTLSHILIVTESLEIVLNTYVRCKRTFRHDLIERFSRTDIVICYYLIFRHHDNKVMQERIRLLPILFPLMEDNVHHWHDIVATCDTGMLLATYRLASARIQRNIVDACHAIGRPSPNGSMSRDLLKESIHRAIYRDDKDEILRYLMPWNEKKIAQLLFISRNKNWSLLLKNDRPETINLFKTLSNATCNYVAIDRLSKLD